MTWQDIIMSIVTIGFGYSLIPQILYAIKNERVGIANQTTVITFIGLYITCIVYFSLAYYFTFVLTLFTGTCWLILFLLKLKYKK